MEIISSQIPEIKIIVPKIFADNRGYFLESFRADLFKEAGIDIDFIQDNISKSAKGTLRGLHYQKEQPQAKLVKCISGKILDVAVDVRMNSETFGQYVATELSEENHMQMFIPEGFAHGFSVLSDEAIVCYKCSSYYHKESERGIRWDDSKINIEWGIESPILSDKDKNHPFLESLTEKDLF
ncbi:MAG: dTDP-4-dehydrorhamnose 3,5-epimerase [Balneolaceae bacterium]